MFPTKLAQNTAANKSWMAVSDDTPTYCCVLYKHQTQDYGGALPTEYGEGACPTRPNRLRPRRTIIGQYCLLSSRRAAEPTSRRAHERQETEPASSTPSTRAVLNAPSEMPQPCTAVSGACPVSHEEGFCLHRFQRKFGHAFVKKGPTKGHHQSSLGWQTKWPVVSADYAHSRTCHCMSIFFWEVVCLFRWGHLARSRGRGVIRREGL